MVSRDNPSRYTACQKILLYLQLVLENKKGQQTLAFEVPERPTLNSSLHFPLRETDNSSVGPHITKDGVPKIGVLLTCY